MIATPTAGARAQVEPRRSTWDPICGNAAGEKASAGEERRNNASTVKAHTPAAGRDSILSSRPLFSEFPFTINFTCQILPVLKPGVRLRLKRKDLVDTGRKSGRSPRGSLLLPHRQRCRHAVGRRQDLCVLHPLFFLPPLRRSPLRTFLAARDHRLVAVRRHLRGRSSVGLVVPRWVTSSPTPRLFLPLPPSPCFPPLRECKCTLL